MPTKRLVGDSVPMLINGVSQQAEILRLPSQVEEQINCVSSLADGVTKRPPSEFLKVLANNENWQNAKIHVIDRDEIEKYLVVMQDDSIKVFDLLGNEITVHRTSGGSAELGNDESYLKLLETEEPKDSFRAHTIADNTFIVNRNVKVRMEDGDNYKSSTGPYRALVWIKSSKNAKAQRIQITEKTAGGDSFTADYKTHDTANRIDLSVDAGSLCEQLNVSFQEQGVTDKWRAGRWGNILIIENNTNDFVIDASNDWSDTYISSIKDSVGGVADLPGRGIPGMRIKITGDVDDESEGFWVKFQADNQELLSLNDDGYEEVELEDTAFGTGEDGDVVTLVKHPFTKSTENTPQGKRQGNREAVQYVEGDFTVTQGGSNGLQDGFVYFVSPVLSAPNQKFNLTDEYNKRPSSGYPSLENMEDPGDTVTFDTVGSMTDTPAKLIRLKLFPGKWVEDVAPNIPYQFKFETMPHVLIRQADGDFRFAPGNGTTYEVTDPDPTIGVVKKTGPLWGNRSVGDEDTAKEPSFVDHEINAVFEWRESLGFASQQSLVLSQRTDYYNFWPTTVAVSLDDARIDVAASGNNVADFHSVVIFQDELIGFTPDGQFTLSSEGPLTPASVSLTETTKYASTGKAKPVNLGSAVGFATTKGNYSSVGEYFIREDQLAYVQESTRHISKYIKGEIRHMSVSPVADTLIALTDEDLKSLYLYQWFWHGNEKAQSSWSKWTFESKIISADFFKDTLYLIMQPVGSVKIVELCKMVLTASDSDLHMGYKVSLDRRVDDLQCGTQTYDAVADTTTIVLPTNFVIRNDTEMVVRGFDTPNSNNPGRVLTLSTSPIGASSVVVQGDRRTHTDSSDASAVITSATADEHIETNPSSTTFSRVSGFFIGETYDSELEFSKPVMRSTYKENVDIRARLQIMEYLLHHEDTGYYKASVYPTSATTSPYEYVVGPTLGGTTIGSEITQTGTARIPVRANSTDMRLVINNDSHIPHHIVSAEWSARYNPQIYRR